MLKYKAGEKVMHKLGIEMLVINLLPPEAPADKKICYDTRWLDKNGNLCGTMVDEIELV